MWLAYAAGCAVFLIAYSLGDYARPESGATVGEVMRYLRVFWFDGFAPMLFGVRVPQFEQEEWHQVVIVAAQVIVVGIGGMEHRAPARRMAGVGLPARGRDRQRPDGDRAGFAIRAGADRLHTALLH